MAEVSLCDFIGVHRDELIGRCSTKEGTRSNPPTTEADIARGVALFLDQLAGELRHATSKASEIRTSAVEHGHDLLRQGCTVGQVVHDYGDICQAITDLAVELAAPIATSDFRTLNRCLDDAIAAAVTEFGRAQAITQAGEIQEVSILTNAAITAFEVLQTGKVGVGGSTGAVVHRSLLAIRGLVDRPRVGKAQPVAPSTRSTTTSGAR
jgi:hypothetical protein